LLNEYYFRSFRSNFTNLLLMEPIIINYTEDLLCQKQNQIIVPEEVDRAIVAEIKRLTEENQEIWTSPDHKRREYVHSFFLYPAMMVPVVQRRIIEVLLKYNPDIKNVIDPFMGSATALVACMEFGLNCYGQDINPLAILIAKTRTGSYNIDEVEKSCKHLFKSYVEDIFTDVEVDFTGINKWFNEDVQIDLSRIVRAIKLEDNLQIRRFFWVSLAETIRLSSNDRTSTYKLHARPKEEIDLRKVNSFEIFKKQLLRSIEDLKRFQRLLNEAAQVENFKYKGQIGIHLIDSSKEILSPVNQDDSFDLLITSPPYGDNKTTITYGQHSYLPLQWIDMNDIASEANKDFLKSTLEIDSRGLGGKISKVSKEELTDLFSRSKAFKETYSKLEGTTRDRVNKVVIFIRDLSKVIDNVFDVMKVNSYQVWTIANRTVGGVPIPNTTILCELIESNSGIIVHKEIRTILNRKMAKRNKKVSLMTAEEIIIFRKVDKENA
jgi:hypothetical protein